jgi:3-dehydroquinate synthase
MKKINVLTQYPYNIEINNNLVIGKELPEGFLVTDRNLAINYPYLVKNDSMVLYPGEKNKSIENYLRIIYFMDNNKRILALGGGVIGDLVGFVASTYKRGINFIQIPTSLTAMVDSSIGGKNGINISDRKNYLGTIYQPEKVLIDPLFLKTLPKKEFVDGIAEIVKYGFIFDNPPLERLKQGLSIYDSDLEDIIFNCCLTKARVVEKDEKDKNYRHLLNFGHTIGHAFELSHNLRHGHAVSIGMVKEAELAYNLGIINKDICSKLKEVLYFNGLSIDIPKNFDLQRIIEIMKADKKGKFVFAFNEENYSVKVKESDVEKVLLR